MRRALLLLAASLALVASADAKTMFLSPRGPNGTSCPSGGNSATYYQYSLGLTKVLHALRTFGVDYTEVPALESKTLWIAGGYHVFDRSTGVQTQFDALIQPNYFGGNNPYTLSGSATVPIRSDSIPRARYAGDVGTTNKIGAGFKVPTLYVLESSGKSCNGAVAGVASDSSALFDNDPIVAAFSTLNVDTSLVWLNHVYAHAYSLRTTVLGGVRPLVSSRCMSSWGNSLSNINVNSPNPDSLSQFATNDSVEVWERGFYYGAATANGGTNPWRNAKPVVYSLMAGAGQSPDTAGAYHEAEGEIVNLMIGIARLDSLTGGKVIGSVKGWTPPTGSIVVRRCLTRGGRIGHNGIAPPDTAAFYSSLNILKALGVPVTFCVDVDSAAYYARDVQKMKENPNAHFIPEVTVGTRDTSNAAGAWSRTRPVDIFGKFRKRAIYGDGSAIGADSSVWAGLTRAFYMADSIFGRDRVERVVLAPDDDWTPVGVNKLASAAYIDSLMWAFNKAGCTSMIYERHYSGADAYGNANSGIPNATNPSGWSGLSSQGSFAGTIPTTGAVWRMKTLGHWGSSNTYGGMWQNFSWNDSTKVPMNGAAGYGSFIQNGMNHFIPQFFLGWNRDYDMYQEYGPYPGVIAYRNVAYDGSELEPTNNPISRACILNVESNGLSGDPNNPARTDLWVIKYVWNAVRAINKTAGRTVVSMTWPSGVKPIGD